MYLSFIFSLVFRRPLTSYLFPYTTLFRSIVADKPIEPRLPSGASGHRLTVVLAEPTILSRPLVGHVELPAVGPSSSDRKSTRLNSSHVSISYAVFCLINKINIRGSASV